MRTKDQRRERYLVRTRNRQPDLVRKAGPHVKQDRHEPQVCPECNGNRYVNCETLECPTCDGQGEI